MEEVTGFVDETVTASTDDVKFGFSRPEMYKESLAATVDPPYGRHIFLCYKSPESWPPRIENSDLDPLPKLFASALKSRKRDVRVGTRFTIFGGQCNPDFSDGDVLVFPDMVRYGGLAEADVDNFIEDVVVAGKPWSHGAMEALTGAYVFVCAHGSRDKRCGFCGPTLIQKFKEEIKEKGLDNLVFISPCSHIGGHKYAGNLIIFCSNAEGKIAGHWYGYVTPNDVPELLDHHIGKGEIIERIWRGEMGEVKAAQAVQESSISGSGCCQGSAAFSCCQDKQAPPGLLGMWERSEFFTAAALVGAAATLAVAYSLYKKL